MKKSFLSVFMLTSPHRSTPLGTDLKSSSTAREVQSHGVTVFNDLESNVTMSFSGQPGSPTSSVAAYFEGNNVLVYIRGTEDEKGEWWKVKGNRRKLPIGGGGVMVNAHYDS